MIRLDVMDKSDKDLEEIISKYDKKLDHVISHYEKNRDNAKDIKQDIYFKLLKNGFSIEQYFNVWGWLKRVTVNHCKNYLRDNSKFKFLDIADNDELNLLENIPDNKSELHVHSDSEKNQEMIYNAVYSLKPKYRDVVVYHDFEEMTYEEIAQKLRIPIGTVKSRLFNARIMLKEKLRDLL